MYYHDNSMALFLEALFKEALKTAHQNHFDVLAMRWRMDISHSLDSINKSRDLTYVDVISVIEDKRKQIFESSLDGWLLGRIILVDMDFLPRYTRRNTDSMPNLNL